MSRNLMTVSEVAEMLGITIDRTYALAREGILPVVRLGRQVRVAPDQVEEWIKKGGKALPGGWKYEKE